LVVNLSISQCIRAANRYGQNCQCCQYILHRSHLFQIILISLYTFALQTLTTFLYIRIFILKTGRKIQRWKGSYTHIDSDHILRLVTSTHAKASDLFIHHLTDIIYEDKTSGRGRWT
jgi:hypothetical protein